MVNEITKPTLLLQNKDFRINQDIETIEIDKIKGTIISSIGISPRLF